MRAIEEIIQEKLLEIEQRERVKILHAVESGSRAWGFASPDSDYDVRFIYVRRAEDYLKLNPPRDVIEWQLDEVLDINGWDLKKALIQFHRGNATLFEWSNSPVVYKTTEDWKQIGRAAKQYFSMKAAAYHYYGTANSTYHQYLRGERVRYKKYFYALRPLLAGRYIATFHCPPPVAFEELLNLELPQKLRDGIGELLALKLKTDEKTESMPIPVVQDFIAGELFAQKTAVECMEDDRREEWAPLDKLFLELLKSAGRAERPEKAEENYEKF